jgi:hypothetical protein
MAVSKSVIRLISSGAPSSSEEDRAAHVFQRGDFTELAPPPNLTADKVGSEVAALGIAISPRGDMPKYRVPFPTRAQHVRIQIAFTR